MANTNKNTYCIFDDFLVFQGRYGKSSMHMHHYLQIGVSNSSVFHLKGEGWKTQQTVSSFYIQPDVSHRLQLSGEDTVLMIWLDPETATHFSFENKGDIHFPLQELEPELKSFCDILLDCDRAKEIRRVVLQKSIDESEFDERVQNAILWIKEHLVDQTISVEQLAGEVYLSPGRFMHLFSEEVGIPVRKFILWQRLKHTLLVMSEGENITKAAHSAGFTDSSHMNRTFNAMFGITPSKIFKNSRFIQVFPC